MKLLIVIVLLTAVIYVVSARSARNISNALILGNDEKSPDDRKLLNGRSEDNVKAIKPKTSKGQGGRRPPKSMSSSSESSESKSSESDERPRPSRTTRPPRTKPTRRTRPISLTTSSNAYVPITTLKTIEEPEVTTEDAGVTEVTEATTTEDPETTEITEGTTTEDTGITEGTTTEDTGITEVTEGTTTEDPETTEITEGTTTEDTGITEITEGTTTEDTGITEVTEGTTTEDPEICPIVCGPDEEYIPNPRDCSSFYQCSNGDAILRPCSPGLVFNPEVDVCVFPEDYECKETC